MNINQKCALILRDLYSYDIRAAYPTILSKQFFDFGDIDLENKEERSTFIGKKQFGNENLSSFLMSSADNLVKFYLKENNILDDEVIVVQRDGFILTKCLDNNDEFIQMELRDMIDCMIISLDRQQYLTCSGGKIDVKGISHYYEYLNKIYEMFANLNFYNKTILFDQMDSIKQEVLNSQDKKLFMIPTDDASWIVITHKENLVTKDPDVIAMSKINKSRYFDHYFKPFLDSIFVQTY